MKRVLAYILVTVIVFMQMPVSAEYVTGIIQEGYCPYSIPEKVVFTINEPFYVSEEFVIPPRAVIQALPFVTQKERRWHRSGYFVCRLISYSEANGKNFIPIKDEIYVIARKHELLDKKEATVIGTELVLTQAAAIVGSCFIIFAPVDIAYFFAKGAIQREKHDNWFKAGVYNAYDNSIFWFWLKGKPIELSDGDGLKIQSIKKEKAEKLQNRMVKIQEKHDKKCEKAYIKAQEKLDKYEVICKQKELKEKQKWQEKQIKFEKKVQKQVLKDNKKQENAEKKLKKQALKNDKKWKCLENKAMKEQLKYDKKVKNFEKKIQKQNARKDKNMQKV